jgi:hypothetical protein
VSVISAATRQVVFTGYLLCYEEMADYERICLTRTGLLMEGYYQQPLPAGRAALAASGTFSDVLK